MGQENKDNHIYFILTGQVSLEPGRRSNNRGGSYRMGLVGWVCRLSNSESVVDLFDGVGVGVNEYCAHEGSIPLFQIQLVLFPQITFVTAVKAPQHFLDAIDDVRGA